MPAKPTAFVGIGYLHCSPTLLMFSDCITAAGGYVDVCRSIIEPIKQRVKVAEAAVASGRKKISLLKKWQGLLTTVLNQRTSRSMTALMLACENG